MRLMIWCLVCFTGLIVMSCKKKVIDLPKRTRFDVAAQLDSTGTQSDSKAKANLTAEYLSSTKLLTYIVTYNGIEVTEVNLNYGTPFALGAGVAVLNSKDQKHVSPLKGSIKLDSVAEDALFKDNLYLNITSVKFPQGEIRGQLLVKDKK